jgi:hypothetical protein
LDEFDYVENVTSEILKIVDANTHQSEELSNMHTEESDDPYAVLYNQKSVEFTKKVISQISIESKIREEVIAFFTEKMRVGRIDLAEFWNGARSILYPNVKLITRKFLSAQATSAESERLFSAAGLIVTDLRKNTSVKNLEKLVFLHQNLLISDFKY